MLKKLSIALLLGATFAYASSASAAMTTDRDEFEDAVSNFTVTSNYGTILTDTKAVDLGDLNASSNSDLSIRKIGNGGWATGAWVQKYTGQVLFSNFANSITLTFDKMVTGFSFLATGNSYGTNAITFKAGGETLTQNVLTTGQQGSAGYFAWFGNAISSLTISTSDSNGFAFGKIAVATNGASVPTAVPGPEAGAGLGALAMGGMALYLKRRRNQDKVAA
ncbi:hypothetical protein [Oryzifoliimicrobium ureilyticus]|uniref:hypothetical protein n=1 Tax=Oryzifoliimicrobium ureilyticus TaxID=3113724 RepID=UPI00307602EE